MRIEYLRTRPELYNGNPLAHYTDVYNVFHLYVYTRKSHVSRCSGHRVSTWYIMHYYGWAQSDSLPLVFLTGTSIPSAFI